MWLLSRTAIEQMFVGLFESAGAATVDGHGKTFGGRCCVCCARLFGRHMVLRRVSYGCPAPLTRSELLPTSRTQPMSL